MRKVRYWSLCCAALLAVGLLVACSGGEGGEAPFAGIHVFEGRVSEGTGGNFVLLVGDQSYALEGNNDEIRKFAGQTVHVSASMEANTLRVTRIVPAPQPPEEG